MKSSRTLAWSLLGFSFVSIAALAAGMWWHSHQSVFKEHAEWSVRVTEQLAALREERQAALAAVRLDESPNLKAVARELGPALLALYFTDTEYHKSSSWTRPDASPDLANPDPRIVAVQLRALELRKPLVGPILDQQGQFVSSVVRPLDEFRVISAVFDEPQVRRVLAQQTRIWKLRTLVFDRSGKRLYGSDEAALITPRVSGLLAGVSKGDYSGWAPLEPKERFKHAITFHWTPATDWLFVLAEPSVRLYWPSIAFFAALAALLLLTSIPWQAASRLQAASWKKDIETFAVQADRFVRGKDGSLPDPVGRLEPFMPLALTLRWLMPQWKKAESFPRELALERKLLSLLIESLPEGILFFNAQGALQLGNELGKVFLGLQREAGRENKIVGQMMVPRGFLEPYVEPVFLSEQRTLGKEVEVAWADGKHLYRIWVEAVQTTEERPDGFIVVIRDITFRKQWESVQEQVLSGITHDLRGPLSAVLGYLDLMKKQIKDDTSPKMTEYIRLAREGALRLSQMVSDILDVVRFEQGKVDLAPQSIDVAELFKRLEATFGVNASGKNVALSFEGIGPSGLAMSGDPKLLERVFDNLIGNAIKFTPAGGKITVAAQRQGGRVTFTIKDTGRGIPKEAQARIFDKFQQVRPGDRAGGYGLGLAVAKFIVEAHKGQIFVESEIDKGSTFTFHIPDLEPTMQSL